MEKSYIFIEKGYDSYSSEDEEIYDLEKKKTIFVLQENKNSWKKILKIMLKIFFSKFFF